MSRFLSTAKRKLKGEAQSLQPEASSSFTSLALSVNSNNPQGDFYSTIGDIGIKVVADPIQAEIDIVFIHGLTGNRDTTWTHKNGVVWPSLLAEDLTTARIMTFGYDADVVRLWSMAGSNNLRNDGKDFAFDVSNLRTNCENRPVIFVAHSLGGLVCEQALLICREGDLELEQLFLATRGIIFMGTPHGGSHLANWGYTVAKYLDVVRRTNKDILRVLKQNSEVLVSVEQQFQQLLQRPEVQIKIFCFFESVQVTGVGWIVTEQSAVLSQYQNQSIAGNHIDMTKFVGRQDSGYQRVFSRIQAIMRQTKQISAVKYKAKLLAPSSIESEQEEQYETRNPLMDQVADESVAEHERSPVPSSSQPVYNSTHNTTGHGDGVTVGNILGNLNMYISDHKRYEECHQVFRTTPYEQHKARNPTRAKGTCQWVLQHPHYVAWYEKADSDILWVSADPGCGKSVLTGSLVDDELHKSPNRVSCYFFFKDDNEDQKSATNALCALLHQLFSQKPKMLKHAFQLFSENGFALKENFHLLWEILESVVMDADMVRTEIVCLMDALDECSDQDRVLLLQVMTNSIKFHQELQKPHSSLKFFLTSRPILSIEVHFSKLVLDIPTVRLAGELATNQISSEVKIFIGTQIRDMQVEMDFDDKTVESLKYEFSKFENRTYLWLKLIIDLIRYDPDLATKDGRRRIFEDIPDSVDEAYSAILNKSKDKKLTRKLLAIICVAPRPLTVEEMTIALKIETHHKCFADLEVQSKEFCKRWIRNICGLFVSVVDDRIYLLHQTAKEFLLSPGHATFEAHSPKGELWKHSLAQEESQVLLAQIMLLVILLDHFGDDDVWWSEFDAFSGASLASMDYASLTSRSKKLNESMAKLRVNRNSFGQSFVRYASLRWASLLRGASITSSHKVIALALRACDTKSRQCRLWWLIYAYSCPKNMLLTLLQRSGDFTPLHLASILDLFPIVQRMIEIPGIDLNARDRISKNSPIWWAALNNSCSAIAVLLEQPDVNVNLGSDSSTIFRQGDTPLLAALSTGFASAAKLLLGSPQIDVNAQNADGVTALSYAINVNMRDMVTAMLRFPGIDVNCQDKRGWTPLALAVSKGNLSLVESLLSMPDINPNCQIAYGDTPLMLAAVKAWSDPEGLNIDGHEWLEILQLLLNHEATDVNIIASAGYTALSAAAANGRTQAMKILFTAPTLDVNQKSYSGMTALSLAVTRNKSKAISLLLSHPRIDVNVQDKEGRSALFLAVFYGYTSATELLLGAKDINASLKDYQGRTPLAMAKENFTMTNPQWCQRRHDNSSPSWSVCRDILNLFQLPRIYIRDKDLISYNNVPINLGPFELQGTESWLGTIFMPCELDANNTWPLSTSDERSKS